MECLKCGKEAHVWSVRRAGCRLVEKARDVAFRRAITLLETLILFKLLVSDCLSAQKKKQQKILVRCCSLACLKLVFALLVYKLKSLDAQRPI